MTNLEAFRSMTMDIDKFAKWLHENCGDDAAWVLWFDKKYCNKCECIPMNDYSCLEYAYCEVNKKCRYFPDLNEIPSMEDIIKMWLENDAH